MTHPLPTLTGVASLLCALALGPAAAQTLDTSSFVAPSVRLHVPSTSPLLGTDVADECALYVARSESGLELTFAGQRVFDAVTVEAGDQTCNGRAEDLLIDAFAGNYERLAHALPARRREAGTRDFSRFLAVLTGRRGAMQSIRALGTMAEAEGDAATYVRVQFVDGEELIRVKWRDDRLTLATRGVLPYVRTHPLWFETGSGALKEAQNADRGVCLLGLEAAATARPPRGDGERD